MRTLFVWLVCHCPCLRVQLQRSKTRIGSSPPLSRLPVLSRTHAYSLLPSSTQLRLDVLSKESYTCKWLAPLDTRRWVNNKDVDPPLNGCLVGCLERWAADGRCPLHAGQRRATLLPLTAAVSPCVQPLASGADHRRLWLVLLPNTLPNTLQRRRIESAPCPAGGPATLLHAAGRRAPGGVLVQVVSAAGRRVRSPPGSEGFGIRDVGVLGFGCKSPELNGGHGVY